MTRMLAEQPLLASIMLGVLSAGLLYGWLQSGKKPMAYIGLVLAALIPVAWIVAENWVTDRERLEQLIHEMADAVEANNHDLALSVIGNEQTRARAAMELPQWEFNQADVGGIRSIEIRKGTLPLQAEVDMNVKVEVSSKRGSIRNVKVPRRLQLKFEKRGQDDSSPNGGWVVTAYHHMPIVGPADAYSNLQAP